jgi:paraquat-inducible protein A
LTDSPTRSPTRSSTRSSTHSSSDSTPHSAGRLLACPECDLLQREPAPAIALGTADCLRCGATLLRVAPRSLELCTAFSIAATALFCVGNAFPVMRLQLQARENSATLFDMAAALHGAGMSSVAALILATVVVTPALELAALLYILVPLALGRVPAQLGFATRLLQAVKPWAMLEVLMLGVLVSIGRLEKVAYLTLGAAFWSLAAMMLLFALIDSIFEPREAWQRADALSRRRAP